LGGKEGGGLLLRSGSLRTVKKVRSVTQPGQHRAGMRGERGSRIVKKTKAWKVGHVRGGLLPGGRGGE